MGEEKEYWEIINTLFTQEQNIEAHWQSIGEVWNLNRIQGQSGL